jgi:uncharacterized protein (DUF433 family)
MRILGHGIYNLPEAARLTGLKPRRVREWFQDRPKEDPRKPVFRSDYRSVGGDSAISFHDLIELFVAGQLREHGVSLQSLRKVHARLQLELDARHPFCRRELLTMHGRVFTLGLDERGATEMVEVLTRQRVFPDVLLTFLQRIDYDEATSTARRWSIARLVVIDPAICLGKPIVEDVGIATAVLSASYEANGRDADRVADWFDVHPRYVLAAVEFQNTLAA